MNSDPERNGQSSSHFKGCSCSTKAKVSLVTLLALAAVLTVAAVCAAVFSSRANTSSPLTGATGMSQAIMPEEVCQLDTATRVVCMFITVCLL